MKSIEEENQTYTFTPKINAKAGKQEKGLESRVEDIIEKKQQRIQGIREEAEKKKELEIQAECTFTPQINQGKKAKKRKVEDLYRWKQQKNDKLYNNMVLKNVEERESYTFQPQISEKSKQI